MKAYCISGLGADFRVYSTLDIHCEKVDLAWISPHKKESLRTYAYRLSKVIDTTEEFIIIGVSFGGVIAVEIAKLLKPKKTFLISTIELSNELPVLYRLMGKTHFLQYLPLPFFSIPYSIAKLLFRTKNVLLKQILIETDLSFVKWAVNALLSWHNEEKVINAIKINGNKDLVLHGKSTNYLVEGGGHFMIVDNAFEISTIINTYLL